MILAPAVSFMYAYRAYQPHQSMSSAAVRMFRSLPRHRGSDLVELVNALTFNNQLRVFEFSGCVSMRSCCATTAPACVCCSASGSTNSRMDCRCCRVCCGATPHSYAAYAKAGADSTAPALARLVNNNALTLTSVDLSRNAITAEGLGFLERMLLKLPFRSTTIRELRVDENADAPARIRVYVGYCIVCNAPHRRHTRIHPSTNT